MHTWWSIGIFALTVAASIGLCLLAIREAGGFKKFLLGFLDSVSRKSKESPATIIIE